jgi:hypothetical protein
MRRRSRGKKQRQDVMKSNLHEDDRKAIDLLLDRTAHAKPVSAKTLAGVESILKLLDEMPVIDPPKDLVRRTLERIDASFKQMPMPGTHAGDQAHA